ncbi:MAG: S53 family peptidase [Planctomycetia bacterium]|nr:S53 family peptidase [Planctomycetia bacterium]
MFDPWELRPAERRARKREGLARRVRLEVEELESRLAPAVLTPVQVRAAYGFDQIVFEANGKTIVGDGAGQTIAIVSAYDHTRIFQDTDVFSKAFSINGKQSLYQQYGAAATFLTKVNPQGTPKADPTGGLWYLETALDVQWAHAIAPAAKIVLVQAKTDSYVDLFVAVDYARNLPGVVAVSMSWGSAEWATEALYDYHFTTPNGHLGGSNGIGGPRLPGGVTFVAASGDHGAPGGWPAMSPNVLAVGGTTLNVNAAGTYLGEVAWSGSGGGISKYEAKPTYQSTVSFSSTKRTNPDVAYNGDPSTGVYVYNSMPYKGKVGGWWQMGGTSAGAPQWAALVAIANQGRALQGKGSLDGRTQTLPAIYNMSSSNFNDVTKGSNGYKSAAGYDLATGRGSPIAQRVVADLVRADSTGKLTAVTGSSTAPKTSAKPLLYVQAVSFTSDTVTGTTTIGRLPLSALGVRDLLVVLLEPAAWQAHVGITIRSVQMVGPPLSRFSLNTETATSDLLSSTVSLPSCRVDAHLDEADLLAWIEAADGSDLSLETLPVAPTPEEESTEPEPTEQELLELAIATWDDCE